MEFDGTIIAAEADALAGRIEALLSGRWTLYQLGVILVAYLSGLVLARRVEPSLERWVRTVRGNKDLLRVLAALLRRTEWLCAAFLLWAYVLIASEITWPSRSYIVQIAAILATAWLFIAVLSRAIRSRFVARIVSWIAWGYVALTLVGLWTPFATSLDAAAVEFGETRVSILSVLTVIVVLAVTLWLAVFVGNFVERRIESVEDLTPSLRVLIGKIVKIVLIVGAFLFALNAVGLDLTAFTVFSGAVGVGLGFGLQKVVSNFVSGIIILLDKSIKPGDTITLGDTFGWIRDLRARYVSIVTRDGKEFLIPNEDFVTQQVINWSFSDELVRLDVHFGVSYDSDPHEVTKLAIEAAGSVDRVSNARGVVCWLTGFGESSLDFVLRFWIVDPQNGLTNIRGKVLLSVWDAFKANDIAIPFPHREVIMRTPVELSPIHESGEGSANR